MTRTGVVLLTDCKVGLVVHVAQRRSGVWISRATKMVEAVSPWEMAESTT